MPIRFSVDVPGKRVHAKITGKLAIEELRDYARDVAAHPDNGLDFDEVMDAREADLTGLTGDDMRGIAQLVAQLYPEPKRTELIIVASSDLAFGLARVYESWRGGSPRKIRVVRSLEEV